MNTFKIGIFVALFLAQFNVLSAQCANLYFYRMTGPQSTGVVNVFAEGQGLFGLDIGHRVKTTICTEGEYIFSVKLAVNGIGGLNKARTKIEAGKDYYFRVGNTLGLGAPTIKLQTIEKGRSDINKNNRFVSALADFVIPNQIASTSDASNGNNEDLRSVKTMNNFTFNLVDFIKAGELIILNYKITNLSPDDRILETCPNNIYFYDDLGNLINPVQVCLSTDCYEEPSYQKRNEARTKYDCNGRSRAMFPSNIPVNARIVIQNMNPRSTKFVRGTIWFKSEMGFRLDYSNLVFPEVIDADNPNKRNFWGQSLELTRVTQENGMTIFAFQHSNNTTTDRYNFKITEGVIFDDKGQQHEINAVSFVDKSNPIDKYYAYSDWNKSINSQSQLDYFVFSNTVSNDVSTIRRVTLNFEIFTLSWENIPITKGINTASEPRLNDNYSSYSEFENRVNRNETIVGQKVVLEKINFDSGSDEILFESYDQLDKLAELMNRNLDLRLQVSGHTDNVGETTSNMLLSQKRADAIRYYLIAKSIAPSRVTSIGKGDQEPILSNDSDAGRKENRRVEIMVIQ